MPSGIPNSAIAARHPLLRFFLLITALALALHLLALPARGGVQVAFKESEVAVPFLPHMHGKKIPGAGGFIYSLSLRYWNTTLQQTRFQIVPGDCLRLIMVNGHNVPFRSGGGCNATPGSYWLPYSAPVYVDLAPYLQTGENFVEVHTVKSEFHMGPLILHGNTHLSKWIGLLMALAACAALVEITRRHTGERRSGFILAVAFLAFLYRFSGTGVSQYTMDLPGHLYYITFIATHGWLPKPYYGWSMFHPPLYYAIEALVLRAADWLGTVDAISCMQLFSLGCFMAFLLYAALSLRRLIRDTRAYYLALILLAFYPSGLMFAARLDSNLLFYALYAACLYFTLRWLQERRHRDIGLALILSGLALATRSNALILFPLLGLAGVYYLLKWGWPSGIGRSLWVYAGVAAVCLGLMAGLGRAQYYRLAEARKEPLVIGNIAHMSPKLALRERSLGKLLLPNIPLYFDQPLWSVWEDKSGRQYFWNSMLKSSLTGEYNWPNKALAGAMGNLLLALILYTADAFMIQPRRRESDPGWFCLAALLIPVAALMANRWIYPLACSQDFRYIYPAAAAFCGLFGLAVERNIQGGGSPWRVWVGAALCLAFALCSLGFYL